MLPSYESASLIVLHRLEHGTFGVPLLAGVSKLCVRRRVAHGVHLRMSVSTLAFVSTVRRSAFGGAAGDDRGCESGLGCCRRGLGLSAERQIEGGEVAALRERRRYDEVAERVGISGIITFRHRTVFLVRRAELG